MTLPTMPATTSRPRELNPRRCVIAAPDRPVTSSGELPWLSGCRFSSRGTAPPSCQDLGLASPSCRRGQRRRRRKTRGHAFSASSRIIEVSVASGKLVDARPKAWHDGWGWAMPDRGTLFLRLASRFGYWLPDPLLQCLG